MPYHWTTTPPNGPALTRVLYDVHGHQVLEDGRFNADPHAGNVMICDDGRLGLIDYGNTPTLTLEERLDVARLVVALDNKDDEAIVRAFKRMGFTVSGGTMGEDNPSAKKMMLFSAYGDFDQQYGESLFCPSSAPRPPAFLSLPLSLSLSL